jgi:hypothetical protein
MLRLKLRSMVTEKKKYEATCKLGFKSKRKIAGWNEGYLLKILGFKCVSPVILVESLA